MSEIEDEARKWLEETDNTVKLVDEDMQKFRKSIGKLAHSYGKARAIIRALLDELEEWEESFELYDNAMRRGTKMWQNASGNPYKVWPDGAVLIAWLMERLEEYETIDPGALRMAADELPSTAEPRAAHLRRIAALVEGKRID